MVRGRAGIAEEEVPASAAEKLSDTVARFVGDMEERALDRGAVGSTPRPRGSGHLVARGPVQGLATVRRTHRATRPGRARLRRPSVGGSRAPRFHRPSPGLESRSAGIRPWSGTARDRRSQDRLGNGAAWCHVAVPRTPRRRDDGVAPARDGARPPRGRGARSAITRRGSRSTPSRPFRMLLDRGLLRRDGNRFEPTGPIEDLDVPETLHTLIPGALGQPRAPGPGAVARRLRPRQDLPAGHPRDADRPGRGRGCEDRWGASSVGSSSRSNRTRGVRPNGSGCGFLQSLMQRVAYETLSRRDRQGEAPRDRATARRHVGRRRRRRSSR